MDHLRKKEDDDDCLALGDNALERLLAEKSCDLAPQGYTMEGLAQKSLYYMMDS